MPVPNPTVLLVEDEAAIRELMADLLEDEGFCVFPYGSADQALDFLNKDPSQVDLLLTDVNMPGKINGGGLANHSAMVWPAIPIIVMSGLETLHSAGIHRPLAFIRKPFHIADMLSLIEKVLRTPGSRHR